MRKGGAVIGNPAIGKRPPTLWSLRAVVCYVTIAACLPYLALKALWLFGYSTGTANAAGAGEMVDLRHIAGNLVTVVMELVAIVLVVALTYSWGQRLPAVVVLVPIWVGTGLLTPIALGLPLGLVAQALVGGSPAPAGNGLDGWVYAVVYGGFIVQAAGLLAAFLGHALHRWPEVFRTRTTQLRAIAPRNRRLATIAAAIAAGYAALLVAWSVAGRSWGGPAGFDTVAQRTFLLSTGLVVLVGVIAVLVLVWHRGQGRILIPLTLAWIGTGVTVTSGPTQVALSNHGDASLLLVVASLAAALAGLLLTGSTLRVLIHPRVAQSPA